MEEDLSPYLPPNKRAYVFGSLAAQAARFVMWLLPELKVGLQRPPWRLIMCNSLQCLWKLPCLLGGFRHFCNTWWRQACLARCSRV